MMLKSPVSDFEIEMHSKLKDRTLFHSRYAFLMAHNGIRPNCLHGLMGSTGCLSGDTVVRLNRNGNGRQYSLKELCVKFGQYPGREHEKSFLDIESNMIRSFIDDENRIGLKRFINVIYSGVKDLYELELKNGMKVKATDDHGIMTKRGMISLGMLKDDDMIMIDKNVRPVKSNKKKKRKALDSGLTVGIHHPHSRVTRSARDGERLIIEKHRVIYEAHINGMSVKEFQEATKSPNKLKFIDPSVFDIHHIDFDHYNNDPDNLIPMKKDEHKRLHAESGGKRHFSQGNVHYSGIRSIKYSGKDETFDVFEVNKTHNFTANDIVVSNSGKSTLTKCIITEAAQEHRVLVWISEENVVEYQELINKLDKSVLPNIVFVEEKEIPNDYKVNQDVFFEYFEQLVEEADVDVVFIDNITTSAFYNQRFGFTGQQKTSEFMINFVKRKCSVFFVTHTRSEVTDNYGKVATPEDIRGSKELALVTEYMYIIQKFTTEDKQFNVLRVAKYRHHEAAAGWYGLKYEKKAYIGDSKVPFAVINKIFKMRDHFGKKLPKVTKENDGKSTPKL